MAGNNNAYIEFFKSIFKVDPDNFIELKKEIKEVVKKEYDLENTFESRAAIHIGHFDAFYENRIIVELVIYSLINNVIKNINSTDGQYICFDKNEMDFSPFDHFNGYIKDIPICLVVQTSFASEETIIHAITKFHKSDIEIINHKKEETMKKHTVKKATKKKLVTRAELDNYKEQDKKEDKKLVNMAMKKKATKKSAKKK